MSSKKILAIGFVQAIAVTFYVFLFISFVSFLDGNLFSEHSENKFLSGVAGVLLFVTSACITGSSVLAYPTVLAFQQRFKEAVLLVAATVFWLVSILTAIVLVSFLLP